MTSRLGHGRWGVTRERGDRAQHFAAITMKNPQLLQIVFREIRKDLGVNSIFHKMVDVLGHAELYEPGEISSIAAAGLAWANLFSNQDQPLS